MSKEKIVRLAFQNMRNRCEDIFTECYPRYGGRGIKVHPTYRFFQNFWRDMQGSWFPGAQLDRINNDADYAPGNLRWATVHEQAQNRRSTKLNPADVIELRVRFSCGETPAQLASRFGIHKKTAYQTATGRRWQNIVASQADLEAARARIAGRGTVSTALPAPEPVDATPNTLENRPRYEDHSGG